MKQNIALATATIIAIPLLMLGFPGVAQAACELFVGEGFTVEVCLDDGTATPSPTWTPLPTEEKTPVPTTPPSGPTATPESPSGSSKGVWISQAEIARLPASGAAWADMVSNAGKAAVPDLSNQDSPANVTVLAKALTSVRLSMEPGQSANAVRYRDEVVAAIRVVTHNNTESGGRTLALGRELAAYVAAADLIELQTVDPALNNAFKIKLQELLSKTLDGRTLRSTHEQRPNNWGTMAGASRAAVGVYLGDRTELDRTWLVFKGYVGDRSAYAGFSYGELSWQCNAAQPVGLNQTGCTKSGYDIGGVMPDDMRRGGGFRMPDPAATGYPWEGLQGLITQAEILHRAGYPAWTWADRGGMSGGRLSLPDWLAAVR